MRPDAILVELDMESGEVTAAAIPAPLAQGSTAAILAAIEQSKTSMLVRIDRLTEECNLMWNDLDKIMGRLTETESRISTTEDLTATHATTIADLQHTVQALVAKSDDAGNRSCRNNIQVLGLPEGEGNCPAEFAEQFFKNLLGLTEIPPAYVVERAYRVPTGRVIPGTNPIPFLVRFLNYQERDGILSEADNHHTLQYANAAVVLFPDLSVKLHRKRKTFNDVRRRLWEQNIKVQHAGGVACCGLTWRHKSRVPLHRLDPPQHTVIQRPTVVLNHGGKDRGTLGHDKGPDQTTRSMPPHRLLQHRGHAVGQRWRRLQR